MTVFWTKESSALLRTGEEMLDVLLEEEYGHMPPAPDEISYTVHENFIRSFCAKRLHRAAQSLFKIGY